MADLLKLVIILALTIFLLIKKWDLGLILLCDSAIVALLFSMPFLLYLKSIAGSIIAVDTLSLTGAVFLVLVLAEMMRRSNAMEGMVRSLQALVPDSRITLALMPLIVGMLPMLGGAMFSAPMVNEVGTRLNLSPDRKTFINYWFRHSMEYIFPLYTSLLMMATLLDVSVYEFIRAAWPMTVVALVSGVLFGLLGVKEIRNPDESHTSHSTWDHWRDLLVNTWPLILVILMVIILKVNMLISLVIVIALYMFLKHIGPAQWLDVLKKGIPIRTFTAIMGVMLFKHVLEDAGAVEQIPLALSTLGLPPLLVAFVVPVIVALLTGTAAAALALSIPLVAPLLTNQQGILPMQAGVWLYVASFSGILMSPLHLCLALTREYFGASWGPLYRRIIPAVGIVVLFALGVTLLAL